MTAKAKTAPTPKAEPDLEALGNELLDAIAETPQPVIGRFRRHSDKLAAERATLVAEQDKLLNERQMTRAMWERYDAAIGHHLSDVALAISLYPEPSAEAGNNVTPIRGAAE